MVTTHQVSKIEKSTSYIFKSTYKTLKITEEKTLKRLT